MKKFEIEEKVFEIIPELNVGVLVLENVEEDKKLSDEEAKEVRGLLKKANREAEKFIESDTISENEVVKVWREVYGRFPTKKGARCSLEALLKRIIKEKPVGTILPSIDITNAISLKYGFPIGVEDAAKFEGDLRLGIMKGNEEFYPIGSEEMEPPKEGEIAYADERGAVCRCLNWRDGKRTEVNDGTSYEFVAMECVDGRVEELKAALDELSDLMVKYLGAKVTAKEILNKEKRSVEI